MPDVEICRWTDLVGAPDRLRPEERDRLIAGLDHVFFASSQRQSFADEGEKASFRERWLGRYLAHYPDFALVALDDKRNVAGYVIGSPQDPARDPLFADLAFLSEFSQLTARYPAQLHVNLGEGWRGHGIGARLVAAFAGLARQAGAPGVHVVTARSMRNVGFYLANGFVERGALQQGDRELLFLGREI
jgi:GNAT superfamily N-acetyltransferase